MVTTIKEFAESFPNVVADALVEHLKKYGLTSENYTDSKGEAGIHIAEYVDGLPFAEPKCPR